MITPFDSGDTLGPKQLSPSHWRHPEANKKFFAHSKVKHCIFLKAFFGTKHAIFDGNQWKTSKIDYLWTFACAKIFWDVVWSLQAPCWIANDPNNTLQTYLVVRRCVKRSEMVVLCETSFSKFSQNDNFSSKIHWKWLWNALKTKKSPPADVWWHRNRLTRRMNTPFDSGDTLGPKQLSPSHWRHQKANKKFFAYSKVKHCIFLRAFFGTKHAILDGNQWKTWKNRLPMDVCVRQKLLRRRMITPSTSLDS